MSEKITHIKAIITAAERYSFLQGRGVALEGPLGRIVIWKDGVIEYSSVAYTVPYDSPEGLESAKAEANAYLALNNK